VKNILFPFFRIADYPLPCAKF